MGKTKDLGHLAHIVAYDAENHITVPAGITMHTNQLVASQSYVTTALSSYALSSALGSYVPTSRTITINGTTYDLSANREWNITSMIYPEAGIALSTGTAWGTSITNNSANWNTAYGWGNHASAGYLTGITSTQVTTALGFTPATSTHNHNGTYVPVGRTITINGTSYDLSVDRSWTITASGTDATKLPLTGGTLTGQLIVSTTGVANTPSIRVNTSSSASFVHTQENFAANITAGQRAMIFFGKEGSTKNAGGIGYYWAGAGSNSNFITLGHWGNDDIFRIYGDSSVQAASYLRTAGVTSNTVLYSSGASSVDFGNAFGQGTTNRSVFFRGNTGVSAWWGGIDANGNNIPFGAIDATAGEFTFWRNSGGTGGGAWTNIMTMNASGLTMNSGNFIGNLSGTASSAGNANTVASRSVGNAAGNIAYMDTNGNLYTNNPEGYAGEVRLGAAWGRGGVYTASTLSLSTSSSSIHFVFSNSVPISMSSSGNINLSGGTTEPIMITGGAHKYLTINPGNGYEAMVRYIGGSGSGWYVGKRTSGQLVGTAGFHFYSESVAATVAGFDSNGQFFTVNTGNFGPDSGDNQGISIRYGSSGYGRVRFHQDGTNHSTIHSFGGSWGSSIADSRGAINISGQVGVTFGAWNVPDGYIATNGSAWFRYDVTAYSDARVKENVSTIDNAIKKVKAIRGVTFTRNDYSDKNKKYAGVIAQEVLAVFPEVVTEDDKGMYSVSYGNMAGLFIEAIKEQQQQIEELKNIINGLTR